VKEQPRIIKASESGQKLKPIPKGKLCKDCGCVLSYKNITPNRVEQWKWQCDACLKAALDKLKGSYRYAGEKKNYNIARARHTAVPRIVPTNIESYNTNYELLIDMIADTEKYRVDRVFSIMHKKGIEAKDKKSAINFLLKSFDQLTDKQCVSVINAVHKLIGNPRVSDDIKVKLAAELKAFTGVGKSSKEQSIKSYEDVLKNGGEVELDD
jgi:hypothetical protein